MSEKQAIEKAHLNLQTGRVSWLELERHFARGVLLLVDKSLDLVEVAGEFANDQQGEVRQKLSAQSVRKVEMSDAATWHQDQTEFWAIVVAPFVLVQIVN